MYAADKISRVFHGAMSSEPTERQRADGPYILHCIDKTDSRSGRMMKVFLSSASIFLRFANTYIPAMDP